MPVLPEIIGWPGTMHDFPGVIDAPSEAEMKYHILRTMPIALIHPMRQHTEMGLEVSKLEGIWGEYIEFLEANDVYAPTSQKATGYNNSGALAVMFQDIAPFSETYTNQFSQSSILGSLENGILGNTAQEIMYYTGKNIPQGLETLSHQKGAAGGVGRAGLAAQKGMTDILAKATGNQKKAESIVNALLSGQKIDFPMMWRSSAFSAQYDLTIRLYNPMPNDEDMYGTLIVAPLIALMALALPKQVSKDNSLDFTYQWPFLVKLVIEGVVQLDAGYVSSLTVVKGGDVNDRSWIGRSNIVDLRMTINPLYNVSLMSKNDPTSDCPTLKREKTQLMVKRSIPLMPETEAAIEAATVTELEARVANSTAPIQPPGTTSTPRSISEIQAESAAALASFKAAEAG